MQNKFKYLYENPYGFTNQFHVYKVPQDMIGKAQELIDSYRGNPNGAAYWITRKEAEKITAAERQKLREQNKMGLNPAQNPVGATSIEPIEYYLYR